MLTLKICIPVPEQSYLRYCMFSCSALTTKLSQTWWINTKEIYFLIFQQARNQKTVLHRQNHGYNRAHSLQRPQERISSLTFLASGACWHSLTCGRITPISTYMVTLPLPLLSVSNLPQSLLSKDSCDRLQLRSTQRFQGDLLISRSLT